MIVYQLREYLTADGVSPFTAWRRSLDASTRARVEQAVERMADGNFGDHKGVGDGVIERRIHIGPGYRIYYGRDGEALVILLAAGSKKTQNRDIAAARDRWKDYKDRKRRGA